MGRWKRRSAKKVTRKMSPAEPRLSDLLRGLEGHWVAIKDGEVRAVSRTPDGVHMKLVGDRITGATILRVPDFGEPELVGFG